MLWKENKISYEDIDKYIFNIFPDFKKEYYKTWDITDLEQKYIFIWEFAQYFKRKFLTNLYKWKSDHRKAIDVLYKIYTLGDEKLKELMCTWFIEDLIIKNSLYMDNLKNVLNYPEFQKCVDSLYIFYYWNK